MKANQSLSIKNKKCIIYMTINKLEYLQIHVINF